MITESGWPGVLTAVARCQPISSSATKRETKGVHANQINSCRVSSFNIPAAIGCLKAILGFACRATSRGILGEPWELPSIFKGWLVAWRRGDQCMSCQRRAHVSRFSRRQPSQRPPMQTQHPPDSGLQRPSGNAGRTKSISSGRKGLRR